MDKYKILMVDTDGISLGVSSTESDTNIKQITQKVNELEKKWQKILDFPDFELDTEEYYFQMHVGHKNYIYSKRLDSPDDISTKGVNFKAKNKSKLSYKILQKVVFDAIKSIGNWDIDNKENMRKQFENIIIENINNEIDDINMDTVGVNDLIMREYVKPLEAYKKLDSIYAVRTKAIENLTNEKITFPQRFNMLVSKEPLPDIVKVSKKSTKAIHYLWPVDYITKDNIDLEWYKNNIRNYMFGAFGMNKKTSKSKKSKRLLDKDQTNLFDY